MGKEAKKPIEERVLPIFTFTGSDKKVYNILYVRGKGLWDEIWGYIALEGDWNTIAGEAFDHKGETPGLGAEIKIISMVHTVYWTQIVWRIWRIQSDFSSKRWSKRQRSSSGCYFWCHHHRERCR
jgi:hypothetical protein